MTVELLIFDCDGVLIDSEPVASAVLARSLQRAGAELSHDEVRHRFTGLSEGESIRVCIDELGLDDPAAVFADCRAELYGEFARSLRPMAGMDGLVRSLPHRKCVASNSTVERLRNSLGLLDLWAEFDPHVFGADMVSRPKPAPDLFFLCAERLGVEPARCAVIDDNAHGIAGAVAAGMRAIGFVDPADPRGGRTAVLEAAGACIVAEGVDALELAIHGLSTASPSAPMPAVTTAG